MQLVFQEYSNYQTSRPMAEPSDDVLCGSLLLLFLLLCPLPPSSYFSKKIAADYLGCTLHNAWPHGSCCITCNPIALCPIRNLAQDGEKRPAYLSINLCPAEDSQMPLQPHLQVYWKWIVAFLLPEQAGAQLRGEHQMAYQKAHSRRQSMDY